MGFSVKDNFQKFLGYLIGSIGILLILLGIAMILSYDPNEKVASNEMSSFDAGVGIAIFFSSFVIIGGILIHLGTKNAKFEENVESAASIAKSFRRIKLVDLSKQLNISIPQANKALSKALSLNLIKGNFDRTTDEFFTEEGKYTPSEFKYCPACGAPYDQKFLEGETIKCKSCGAVV